MLGLSVLSPLPLSAAPARHVVLFIGDGMGPAQVEVGRLYRGSPLSFEHFPHQGAFNTAAANSAITDSAAAATAMAVGSKVNNGVISMALPGDGADYPTIVEQLQHRQRRLSGLVTTSYLTDATPAAFAAHEPSRGNRSQIAADYLTTTRPDLLLGGGGSGLTPNGALAAGYTVVTNAAGLLSLSPGEALPLAGLFGEGSLPYVLSGYGDLPSLATMTAVALAALEHATNGFFLMVEGGRIDHACHENNLDRCIPEVLAFSDAVAVATNWATGRSDTLILVTADHETGGLQVLQDMGAGTNPVVSWASGGHTATPVPVYGWGVHADRVTNLLDNTGIYDLLVAGTFDAPLCMTLSVTATGSVTRWAGVGGHTCHLESATNLTAAPWQTVTSVTATRGPLTLVDTNPPPAAGPVFYRLQIPP